MKPTGDVPPRRDGWHEHEGTWGEVTVGTVIANAQRRTERWEIIEQAMGTPVPFLKTLWMRAREQTTGAEFTSPPRTKTAKVIILTQDPADTRTAPGAPPADADAIMLLVEELGATLLATRDETTGEITCPDYINDSHLDGDGQGAPVFRGLIEHMRIAHNWAEQADAPALDLAAAITLHGALHSSGEPAPGGFPHRHVPEDLKLITGIDRR